MRRPWTDKIYVPPEQVVGSSIKTKFVMRDGIPTTFRLPVVNFIDDKDGKQPLDGCRHEARLEDHISFPKAVSGGGVAHWHPNNRDFQLAALH